LLVVDYKDGLKHYQRLEGEFLLEETLELTTYGDKVRYFASIESPMVQIDDFDLENTNDNWYNTFHDHPVDFRRYNNILYSEFEILGRPTSIKDKQKDYSAVYPNPSTGMITVSLPENFDSYSIYDINGKLLDDKPYKSEHLIELDQGTYFLQFRSTTELYTEKVIIH